jgi:hypothetical protein
MTTRLPAQDLGMNYAAAPKVATLAASTSPDPQ